ncbi:hypothetical protein F4779DRAFT_578165 [Xylariaceae sp. FL0662B]|nr:hypothetical protein F4779DRAFT_578165 [Xylariaceae sp. FL0662B]
MSVENIWPNKIEYSVVIPQKAIVFGSCIPLEMRFTPLLKGLEMGNITVKLIEIQEFTVQGYAIATKIHKHDRDVTSWNFETNREQHWHDNIEETGQEGWVVNKELPLPKRLTRCIQDCTVHGIKIRHKLKLTVGLKNPDGHVSELRATLPVTIFISPNMPLDEEGNLVSQSPETASEQSDHESSNNMAPPGYGMHVLDQLYDDIDPSGILTPPAHSGLNSPFYAQSRAGSSENVVSTAHTITVTPAALSSRLQDVSLEESHRNLHTSNVSGSGATTPLNAIHDGEHTADSSLHSMELSRQPSEEEHSHPAGHHTPPEHREFPDIEQLSKVPSYTTATRAPLPRTPSYTGSIALPDYQAAMSAPASPTRTVLSDPMATISERSRTDVDTTSNNRSRSTSRARQNNRHSMHLIGGFSFFPGHAAASTADDERRLRVVQGRSG